MNKVSRYGAIALGLVLLALFVFQFSEIVAYILIGWIVSLLGLPIIKKLKKIKIKKWGVGDSLSAALTLLLFILIIFLFFLLIFPPIIHQAQNLSQIDTSEIVATVEGPINEVEDWLVTNGLAEETISLENEFTKYIKSVFNPKIFFGFFQSIIGTASSLFIGVFSILFISFFFLKDQKLFDRLVTSIVPDAYEDRVRHAISDSSRMLRSYFGGLVLQLSLFFVVIFIALLVLGFKNALLIAFIAALLNVIPYLGPALGAIFAIFITISSNVGMDFYSDILPQIAWLGVVFFVVQQIDGFIIQPFVFSNSVQAHPLEIFLIILMGGQVAGVPGMILAIPAYTILRVLGRIFFNEYKIVRRLTQDMT